MKITRTPEKCTAKLGPGEAKRIPKHRQYLAGYYVGCPACGWVVIIPQHGTDHGTHRFVEEEIEGEERLTMKAPETCPRPSCKHRFAIVRDEFVAP